MGDYVPIKEEKFGDYYLLAMRFFVGHKPKYADFDSQLFAQIKELYANMQKIGNKTDIKVLSSQNNNIEKYVNAINNAFFDKSNNFVIRIINKLFWQRFKKDILHIAAGQEVIHGDLTVNNLLLNESGKIYLLDYGNLQYGYPLEDFVGLIMQLSGFSGIVGRCRHFIKLKKALQEAEIPLADEAQMWLYAVQMFYLKKLQRRFNGVRAKRNSLRKNLCLLLCLLQYFKLAKILQK
jgi:serine/threonine protein kinase